MVVEDNHMLLQAISKKLEINGYQIVPCTSGEQVFTELKEMEQLPDLIWLDYYLAGVMNGLDVISKLKQDEKWKNIPIVIVSNTASEEKVKVMMSMGATKYFLKAEYRLDSILEQIEQLINNKE